MENTIVICSKMCYVEIIGDENFYIKADLSIVSKDGKYGLMHSSKIDTGEKDAIYENSMALSFEYENLLFIEVGGKTYLVAVVDGKQGLYKLKGCKNGCVEEVIAERLLPCVYDRVEVARKNKIFLLYNQDKISCYLPREERMLTVCDHVIEPCTQYLLCSKGEENELWNTFSSKCLIKLPSTNECKYAGIYESGDVFKLRYWDKQTDDYVSQLLFCDHVGQTVRLSPKSRWLSVMIKTGAVEQRVVRVEMSWGDFDSPLLTDTVRELTKEEIFAE